MAIIVLVYLGLYIPIALGVVSFVSIWLMRDNFTLAMNLLKIAVGDSVMEYTFATVPLFTFMGLVVSKAGLGADIYKVMNSGFRRVKGGIGMATVGANAVFAAVTGSSIAIGLGLCQGLGAADAALRLQPALCGRRRGGIERAWHDHPAVGDADHLFLRGRAIGRRHVPGRVSYPGSFWPSPMSARSSPWAG